MRRHTYGVTPSRLAGVLATLVVLGSTAVLLAPQSAATPQQRHVAANGSDTGNDCTVEATPCATIQHAVTQAASGDSVIVGPGTYGECVQISKGLTLVGAGSTGPNRTTISGGANCNPSVEIFPATVGETPSVTLQALDISGNAHGYGVLISSAEVTITDSSVSQNEAGIAAHDTGARTKLHVTGTSVLNNAQNGISDDYVELQLVRSSVGGNGGAGVAVWDGATFSMSRSTVFGTVPATCDGCSHTDGTGVVVDGGATATIVLSTIDGNTAQGIWVKWGSASVTDSTIAHTQTATDTHPHGGLVVDSDQGATASLSGTIVAANETDDCAGGTKPSDYGYDLDSDSTCQFSATGSQTGVDVKLGLLGDHGGPTFTVLPGAGSPAIDKIPAASCAGNFTADQRDLPRPAAGTNCDIGAVETVVPVCPPLVVDTESLPDATAGQPYSAQLLAHGDCDDVYHWTLAAGGLPPGLELGDLGKVAGTPTQGGDYSFVVSVNDPVRQPLAIHVRPAPPAPRIPATPSSATPTPSPSASPSASARTTPPTATPRPTPTPRAVTRPASAPATATPTRRVAASGRPLAQTGTRTRHELALGLLATALGTACLMAARQRRTGRPARR